MDRLPILFVECRFAWGGWFCRPCLSWRGGRGLRGCLGGGVRCAGLVGHAGPGRRKVEDGESWSPSLRRPPRLELRGRLHRGASLGGRDGWARVVGPVGIPGLADLVWIAGRFADRSPRLAI